MRARLRVDNTLRRARHGTRRKGVAVEELEVRTLVPPVPVQLHEKRTKPRTFVVDDDSVPVLASFTSDLSRPLCRY